jgi:hypothetical protein
VAELTPLPSGYSALLEELKTRIRAAQLRAALTLNQETILLYWSIGQDLSSRFAAEGWGTKVVDRLAKDLGTEFPGVEGFSLRNLRYMRSFAEAWPDPPCGRGVRQVFPPVARTVGARPRTRVSGSPVP